MQRLNTSQVMTRLGIRSRETLRTLIKDRGFPRPIRDAGSKINYYVEEEVNSYLQHLVDARDSKAGDRQPAQSTA